MKEVIRITYLLAFFVLLLFLLPSPGYCEDTVYVSVDGNDSNPGSISEPFRTIKYAIFYASSNKHTIVKISEGEYFENIIQANGVSVFGGYSQDFFSRDTNLINYRTKISGSGKGIFILSSLINEDNIIEGLVFTNYNNFDSTNLIIRNIDITSNALPLISNIQLSPGMKDLPQLLSRSLTPLQGQESTGEQCILWNKLGSDYEVTHSEVGPGLGFEGDVWDKIVFEECKFDNGVRTENRYQGVTIPSSVLDPNKGCYEMWFKSQVTRPVAYQYGILQWLDQILDAAGSCISMVWRDLSNYGYQNNLILVHIGDSSIFDQDESVPFNAEIGRLYHIALVWDVNGIDGTSDSDTVRIYIDGELYAASTKSYNPIQGINYAYIGRIQNQTPGWVDCYGKLTCDNVKIWNYAKTDFSDRFIEGGGEEEGIQLVFPADGTTINDITPTFKWEIPEEENNRNLHFKIEIAEDAGFSINKIEYESKDMSTGFMPMAPVLQGKGTQFYTMLKNLGYNTYYWRVSAWNGDEYYIESPVWSFTIQKQ